MANQINIDIGAAANDGTGDPLRTAFNYVNLNFANVWATGLPNSNVQISDNRILTVNTNANLVLAPNGIGKVASNVDIVPNTANVFALGGATRRWNTIYGQYLDLSHNAIIGGNLTVTGNLSASNISYTSNVFVGDLEGSVFDGASSIVLDVIDSAIYVDNYYYANGAPFSSGGTPGGSNTQIQFNDNGVFGGNVNFAFFKDTGGLQAAGNVFPYANALVNLGTPVRQWNTLYVGNVLSSNNTFTTTLVANAVNAGNVTVANITTSQNLYANTGTFYGDQYSDGAIYIGNPAGTVLGSDVVVQITANADGYSQTNFQNINSGNTASGDYIITADNGNDTTHYIDLGLTSSGWDGSETNVLSGLSPNNGYLYVQDGNLTLGTRNGNTSYSWNFYANATMSAPGDITTTGNISGNVSGYAIGYRDIPQVTLSANATAALTDAGKHFYSTTAGNLQITIPDNANVAYPTGAALTVVVNAAGNVLIAQGTGVSLYMAGSSTTGNRTVGAYGLATVMKVATNTWVISGTGVY